MSQLLQFYIINQFILVMQSYKEVEFDQFPHIKDKHQQLAEVHQTYNQIAKNQEKSPFRKRFPWLAFMNSLDELRYSYIGKHTQKNTSFLVSFDVRSTAIQKNRRQIVQEQMQKLITAQTDGEAHQQEKIFSQMKSDIYQWDFNDDLIGQAYILTGLAKPSITINEIYDALFYPIQQVQSKEQKREESQMQNSSFSNNGSVDYGKLIAYFKIKNSWQSKRKSYEFHKLMCKAYLRFEGYYKKLLQKENKQNLAQKQQKIWQAQQEQIVSNKIRNQLFSKMRSRHVQLYNQVSSRQSSISDEQYYIYFCALFKNHAKQIAEKIDAFQKQSKSSSQLQISFQDAQIRSIKLQKFDYRHFALNLCSGVKLSQQSVQNMILFHRKNHQNILNKIEFKTKEERLQQLANLAMNSNHSFAIKLVPLGEVKSQKKPQQIDNYLIVVERKRRIRQTQLNLQFSLSDMINDQQNDKGSLSASKQSKIIKQNIFQSIFDTKSHLIVMAGQGQKKLQGVHQTNILQKLSFNPKNICFDYRNKQVYPKFQYALHQYLQIGNLPLSFQQKILNMTPKTDLDIYQVIQNLYEEFRINLDRPQTPLTTIQQKIIKLKKLCQNLSSQHLIFTLNVSEAHDLLEQFCNIYESKLMDKKKLVQSFHQIENQVIDKAVEIIDMSELAKQKQNYSLYKDQFKQLVKLCLDSISKSELLKLLMLSLFEYQLSNKQRHIFQKQRSQKDCYLDDNREPYQKGNEQDEKVMYQYGMILLILSSVISCVDFSFPKKDQNKSLDGVLGEKFYGKELTIKAIIQGHFLQNLIEYFKSLFLIFSAELKAVNTSKSTSEDEVSLTNTQVQLDEGPLQSLFLVYNQLMAGKEDYNNEANKALIKAGMINNIHKEGLQLMKRLINIDQQLQYLKNYKVNLFERIGDGTFGDRDFERVNFENIYKQIGEKYTKICQLYQKSREDYGKVKIDNFIKKFQSGNEKWQKKVVQLLKAIQSKRKKVQLFFKKQTTGHHKLADMKNTITKIKEIKQYMNKLSKDTDQYKQKEQIYADMLNKLTDNGLIFKKEELKKKEIRSKKQLDAQITRQCRQIEQAQIILFNQIYSSNQTKKKQKKIPINQQESHAEDIKTLRVLSFFLYSQPKFDKNHIQRLFMLRAAQQTNYELVRMINMLAKCNYDMWERQRTQNK